MLKAFGYDLKAQQQLAADLNAPSLYDEFLRYLARRGFEMRADRVERDWSQPYHASADVEGGIPARLRRAGAPLGGLRDL